MPGTDAVRILVVDDDAKIVRLMRTYLEREGFVVDEALDGGSALTAIEAQPPALVVLDVMLPEIDGLSIVRAVRQHADTPIIIVSALGAVSNRLAGLGVGADDYLAKPFSPAELVLRVQRVLARTSGRASGATAGPLRRGGLTIDRDRATVDVDDRRVPLTAIERRLLVALVEADGRVLSRDKLLDAAYGPDAEDVLDRTIDVHIGRLRTKLGDSATGSRFIETVRGEGYRSAGRNRAGVT